MKYIIVADTSYKKRTKIERYPIIFLISYLAVPQATLDYHRGDRVTDQMFITGFIQVLTRRSLGTS